MRVTMLVRCLAMMRGGGETRHLAWMRELMALGVEVDVITGQPLLFGAARHPVQEVNATTIRSPYLRDAVYRWQATRGFGRLTATALHVDEEWFCRDAWKRIASRPQRPDVVHSHAVYQAARLRRDDVPVVVNLPGAPHARYVDDLRQADALVADGWAARQLPAMLQRPVHHVPKGVDTDRFRPDGDTLRAKLQLRDKRVIVGVGRLVPIKNPRLLIEAMPLVRAQVPHAHLLLVGDGPEQGMLQQLSRDTGVADAVTFAGYVPNADLGTYYRTADLFALTSTFDNSPNVVLEAMACGLPVVATDVGGVREFVDVPIGGELVPSGDAVALARAISAWLVQDRAAKAATHIRKIVLDRYSWRVSAMRLLEVYEQVVSGRRQRHRVSA